MAGDFQASADVEEFIALEGAVAETHNADELEDLIARHPDAASRLSAFIAAAEGKASSLALDGKDIGTSGARGTTADEIWGLIHKTEKNGLDADALRARLTSLTIKGRRGRKKLGDAMMDAGSLADGPSGVQ